MPLVDAATPVLPGSAAPEEAAPEIEVTDPAERIRDLEARLTKEGRSKAQIKAEADSLRAEREADQRRQAELAEKVSRWEQWYLKTSATPAEREKAVEAQKAQESTAASRAKSEADTWRAIAEEENPTIKRALAAAASKGEYFSKKAIEALRESLAPVTKEVEDPEPPKVSPKRTTVNIASLDEQIAAAKKAKNIPALLNLEAEKQKALKAQ